MRAYLLTTGCAFGLILVAHAVRVFVEGAGVLRAPDFVISSLVAAGLLLWAIRLLRRLASSPR